MTREYSKTTSCKDANEILTEWLKRRKKGHEAEEKILSAIIQNEQSACIPIVAKQLKEIFDIDINNVIEDAIKLQTELDKPHESITPEYENSVMRGKKKVLESVTSINELNDKLNDALSSMNEVYNNRIDMQNLWRKRLYKTRDDMLKKIERMK